MIHSEQHNKQLWLKKFSTPCNATHPKVIISIQFPSPGSCSLPSGSSNDMWPWWYKPSSGNVRSKSSNNEASRRNLWSSVCCREGCGNNAQRSIHSVLRGTSCNVFFFLPVQLDTPWNEKSSCLTKKGTFTFLCFEGWWWFRDVGRYVLDGLGFVIHAHSMKSLHLFWNRNVICDGSGCTIFSIRFYWRYIAFLPPFHPAIPPFWPKDLLGFRYDSSFQLALPHHFAMRILEDEDASCPRSVGLDRFQGENQGVVVICIRLEGILDVLRLEIGWNECLDSWMFILTWEITTVEYTMFFRGHRIIYFTATYHSYSRNGISCGFRWFTYSWDSQWRKASRKTSSLEPRCSKQVVVRTTSRRDDEIHIGSQLPQQQRCKGVAHGGNVPKSSGKLLGAFEMEVLKTGTANPPKAPLLKHMFKSVFSFPTMWLFTLPTHFCWNQRWDAAPAKA